jgi:hypothetical protein
MITMLTTSVYLVRNCYKAPRNHCLSILGMDTFHKCFVSLDREGRPLRDESDCDKAEG